MATTTISPTERAECIRLQSERVVRAYRGLVATPKNSQFADPDFPVGALGELMMEIRRLEGWLEPAADDESAERSRGDAKNALNLSLDRISALADLLALADGNSAFGDHTVEVVGFMLLEQATAARDANARLAGGAE